MNERRGRANVIGSRVAVTSWRNLLTAFSSADARAGNEDDDASDLIDGHGNCGVDHRDRRRCS